MLTELFPNLKKNQNKMDECHIDRQVYFYDRFANVTDVQKMSEKV